MAYKSEDFLNDISTRKEFLLSQNTNTNDPEPWRGFHNNEISTILPGLKLHGAQLFIRNFQNPNTDYKRILIKWQTGVGKSIAAIGIAYEYIRQYRLRASFGEKQPTIFVLTFNRETIQEDLLKFPEFGFISQSEVDELRKYRIQAQAAGSAGSQEAKQLSSFIGVLKRRLTDKSRGGCFKFFGYKEFANKLFKITSLGKKQKFNIHEIYSRNNDDFREKLFDAVDKKFIIIDRDLIESMRGGVLVADEIQNVYNIMESNNYGIAIQYILDELGNEAPRAIYMSATPVTGSAAEFVDLLNLLVPKVAGKLKRSDFFLRTTYSDNEDDEESANVIKFIISQLKEGALEQISKLATGYVSFLLDSDINAYPRRILVGTNIDNVPYLKLTLCPMSKLHSDTLREEKSIPTNAYTLYDMVFPNPTSHDSGLFRSQETQQIISSASQEWRDKTGIEILEDGIFSGQFLHRDNIVNYSSKYYRLLNDVIAAIKAGPGKIMIYHHRVRMSGVLLLQELFKMNGILDEFTPAVDNTLCAICGEIRKSHSANSQTHEYTPARMIIAHSDIDKNIMIKSILKYNSLTNKDGYQLRIIIGSKIIKEGLNFFGVRHQFITSLPTDYPTLIQVFGRVVRKESHNMLLPEERNVKVYIYVSSFENENEVSPEVQRYIDKGKEFSVIQEVERVLHENAIDGFLNYGKINEVIQSKAGLDALPYTPTISSSPESKIQTSTFLAYGHGEREVAIIASICRVLFRIRSVWTSSDLWNAIKAKIIKGVSYDPNLFDEGNFELALFSLSKPVDNFYVKKIDNYFIASFNGANLDIESYFRNFKPSKKINFLISEFVKEGAKSDSNWEYLVQEYENTYFSQNSKSNIELSLIDYGADFHYTMMKKLIEKPDIKITIDDPKIIKLYKRFKIMVTSSHKKGYITNDAVMLYDGVKWNAVSHYEFGIEKKYVENNYVVGFVESEKFKLRAPIQKLKQENKNAQDTRSLAKGAVCKTRPRLELEKFVKQLRTVLSSIFPKSDAVFGSGDPAGEPAGEPASDPADDFAIIHDLAARTRFPSAKDLCYSLKNYLLSLEEHSRTEKTGIKWLYLFNEPLPNLAVLIK